MTTRDNELISQEKRSSLGPRTMKASLSETPELALLRVIDAVITDGEKTRSRLDRMSRDLGREFVGLQRSIEELTAELKKARRG